MYHVPLNTSKLLSLVKLMNEQAKDSGGSHKKGTKGKRSASEEVTKNTSPVPRYAPFIDKQTKYKHYNHKKKEVDEDGPNSSPISSASSSSSISPQPSKLAIDDQISDILGFPKDIIASSEFWPYTSDTLNELLKFKTQQELTKQETAREHHCQTALELLKLARDMNFSEELIPFLFVPGSVDLEEQKLQLKRKRSDIHLPSFSETAQSIKTFSSAIVSPLRSPNKSPSSGHRRIISDSSEATTATSPPVQNMKVNSRSSVGSVGHAASTATVPTPATTAATAPAGASAVIPAPAQVSTNPHSLSTSPSLAPLYPVYYSNYPIHPQQLPQPQQPAEIKIPKLGSPYSQKYQYQNQYYQYYSTSPNSTYVPPPKPSKSADLQPQQTTPPSHSSKKQPVPPHQFETADPGNRFSAVTHEDITPSHKKQKQVKHSSINFMITTPKNPPARKYNNPREK